MDAADLLLELYGRIPPLARAAVQGLDAQALSRRPGPEANPVGWLVWHLARVEDDHVAAAFEAEQVWSDPRWAPRFGLPAGSTATGFAHSQAEVDRVRPDDPATLLEYLDAVHEATGDRLRGVGPGDLDRVVDRRWDPPVTLGVRLVSVADDCLQHAGQAAYVRGLLLG